MSDTVKRAVSGQNLYTLGDRLDSEDRALLRAAYRREAERQTHRRRRTNKQRHRGRKR